MLNQITLIILSLFLIACNDPETPAKAPDQGKGDSTSKSTKSGSGKKTPAKQPPKSKTVKGDPTKPETKKSNTGKTDPAKNEEDKPDADKDDPTKTDPDKADPTNADPTKTDPDSTDPSDNDAAKSDPTKTDPSKADPTKLVVEEVPAEVQAFLDDPELQLLAKTADELKALVKKNADDYVAIDKSLFTKDQTEKLFSETVFTIFKMRLLMKDKDEIKKSITRIAQNKAILAPYFKKYIQDMENKSNDIKALIPNDLSGLDDKIKDAYTKLKQLRINFANLLGNIKSRNLI